MKNKIYKAFSITLPLYLTGCMGIYEGGFECPAGTGVGCKSISEVNALVNLGELPKSVSEMPIESSDNTFTCHSCGRCSFSNKTQPEIWVNPLYLKGRQKIQKEERLKNREERFQKTQPEKELLRGTISL